VSLDNSEILDEDFKPVRIFESSVYSAMVQLPPFENVYELERNLGVLFFYLLTWEIIKRCR
jgi:hypothetical protein